MQNKFSKDSREVISLAVSYASEMGHIYVGTEHLLLALAETGVDKNNLNPERIRMQIYDMSLPAAKTDLTDEDMTPALQKVLSDAAAVAVGTVTPRDIFFVLIQTDCVATRMLEDDGVEIEEILLFTPRERKRQNKPKTPTLDKYAVSLTEKARRGEIDPVVGREKEEERVIRILLRRRKNNPVLIGEAGVGKTAVAESIALRIVNKTAPKEMLDKRILSLDMASVVAGTKYRGEFEEKLRSIIREATEDKTAVLFIDEIHTLAGAGAAEGAVDASNILKPALARGDIQLMGATTPKEYKRYIEKDAALSRRFQPVNINEVTVEQCKELLVSLKPNYEKHHGIIISEDALSAAAEYSSRYIHGRYLPDKAIDLIDEGASAKRMHGGGALTRKDIALLTSEMSGVPEEFISGTEDISLRVGQVLEQSIVGQRQAVRAVVNAVSRREALPQGVNKRPCSMLFYGKSGVGKTECAYALARGLCGSEKAAVCIDMAQYTDSFSASRLIGASHGYSPWGENGILTGAVKRAPFSVVVFDGIEKAHEDVINLISQILDKGFVTDSDGNEVSFSHTTVVLIQTASHASAAGFCTQPDTKQGGRVLPPAISDKIGDIIYFPPLTEDDLKKIALRQQRAGETPLSDTDIAMAVSACGGSARTLCRTVNRLARDNFIKKTTENPAEY